MHLGERLQHLFKILGRQEIIFQDQDGLIELDTLLPQQKMAGIAPLLTWCQWSAPEHHPVLVIRQGLQPLGETFKTIHRIEKLEIDASGRQDGLHATAPLDGPLQTNDVNFHDLPLQTASVLHAVQPSRWRP
ncbi:hypothetical protein D3C79_685410 [compost metagenome]